jgi:dUTP pyrophosphatase
MSFLQINVKYCNDDIDALEVKDGSDWIDLRAAQETKLEKGKHYLIPLGVCIELPRGYEAYVAPRSSSFKNWGVLQANGGPGVVDESYCGDDDQWFWSIYATRDAVINLNDRVCQFRVHKKQPRITFNEVDRLLNKSRGGHGTTGKQ